MKKILITGGAGFIGSYIVDELHKQQQYEIVVLDNFSEQIHGNDYQDGLLYNQILNKCSIVHGDVRDKELLTNILKDVEVVIHLASETGTGQSMYEINKYTEVNILGTSNLLEAIMKQENKVEKIILSSSRSVYGEGMYSCSDHGIVYPRSRDYKNMIDGDFSVKCPHCNLVAELIPTNENAQLTPISYYAYTKLAQEQMLETMCPMMGIDYTIFRYQNVFGAGQSLKNPYTGILSIFSKLLLNNDTINIFEDGLESRDFIEVKDVARITCDAVGNSKTNNRVINVGSGGSTSVLQIANILKHYYSSESMIEISGDFRKGDIRHNIADLSLAKELCDFTPKYTFEEGISEFVQWVLKENNVNSDNLNYNKSLNELLEKGLLIQKK